MKEPELKIMVGVDRKDRPIYKTVKKLYLQYFSKDNVLDFTRVKPFWNGQYWMFKAFDKLFFIDKDSIFFDKKYRFYVLMKPLTYG